MHPRDLARPIHFRSPSWPRALAAASASPSALVSAARGMKWLHLPIVDVNIPSASFEAQWRVEVPELLAALRTGSKILVHCKGGLGRTGLVAAMLLMESGETSEAAIRKVRNVRPGAI